MFLISMKALEAQKTKKNCKMLCVVMQFCYGHCCTVPVTFMRKLVKLESVNKVTNNTMYHI